MFVHYSARMTVPNEGSWRGSDGADENWMPELDQWKGDGNSVNPSGPTGPTEDDIAATNLIFVGRDYNDQLLRMSGEGEPTAKAHDDRAADSDPGTAKDSGDWRPRAILRVESIEDHL